MNAENDSIRLSAIFDTLNEDRKKTLLEFAEFLEAKGDLVTREMAPVVTIEKPKGETVVGAIKRLKLSYPMIESMSVFTASSSLMTEHMINGREAMEVIDDMEKIFEEAYQALLQENK